MSEGCNTEGCNPEGCSPEACGSCSQHGSCGDEAEQVLTVAQQFNNVKNVIAVVSGKGGVGKSLVTAMLAVLMRRKGYRVGVLDADITGPSMPKVFGVPAAVKGTPDGSMLPCETKTGIEMMSINLLLKNDEEPVVWRGPMIGSAVQQFWNDVLWGDEDYLFVDMPPGTGDVPLTVFQNLPVKGVIIVTTPQDLVSMIVKKAYNMAKMMNIPVLGLVENMSYLSCPDCGKKISIFGESHVDEVAKALDIPVLAQMGIDPAIAALCDAGDIESMQSEELAKAADLIEKSFPGLAQDELKHAGMAYSDHVE